MNPKVAPLVNAMPSEERAFTFLGT